MKKVILITLLLTCFGLAAQSIAPVVDAVRFNAKSEAEMLNFVRAEEGTVCYREDTDSLWRYNGATWAEVSGGAGISWSSAVDSDIVPTGNPGLYDLGNETDYFAQLYINNIRFPVVQNVTSAGTGQGLQIGPSTGINSIFGSDEVYVRNNGGASNYYIGADKFTIGLDWDNDGSETFEIKDGLNATVFTVFESGNVNVTGDLAIAGAFTGSNLSGTNTGDQTITLTGDVTGSGTGSFATTIAAGAVEGSMILDGTISALDINTGAIETSKIAVNAVTLSKIDKLTAITGLDGHYLAVDEANDQVKFVEPTAAGISYSNTISGLAATDVKSAIDEVQGNINLNTDAISSSAGAVSDLGNRVDSVVTALNVIPASAFTLTSYTAPQTVTGANLADNALVVLDYNDEDFTIHKDSIAEGQAVRIILDDAAAGTARIVEGDSVSILGYTDGITLSSYPSGVTLVRKNSTTSPARQFIIADYFGSIADYVAAVQIHTQSNAAADPNGTEANATTGWTTNTNSVTTSSSTDQVNVGTYAIKLVSTSGTAAYGAYTFAATAGDTFTVTWDEIRTVGTTGTVTAWQNCSGGPSFDAIGTSWESESYNITASATGNVILRFYAANGGSIGDTIYIDNLSVIKTN